MPADDALEHLAHLHSRVSLWAPDVQADAGPGDRRNHSFLGLLPARDSPRHRAPPPPALRAPPPQPASAPAGQPSLGSGPAQLSLPARENEQGWGRNRRPRAGGVRFPQRAAGLLAAAAAAAAAGGGGREVAARAGWRRAAGRGLRPVAPKRACRQHGGVAGQAGLPAPAAGAVHARLLPDAASQCQEAP